MPEDEKQAVGFGRLEALIEASRKEAAESADRRERAAVDRHDKLASEVKDLKTNHANLVLEVGQLKVKATAAELLGPQFAEHMAKDDATTAAIGRHIKAIEESAGKLKDTSADIKAGTAGLVKTNEAQNIVLTEQTRLLNQLRVMTPLIVAICTALVAVIAAVRGH